MLDDGHLVLGQGAGLVRADNLRAAQRFDSGQPADDCVALGHIGHADRKHDGDNGGQAFGDGGDSQRNRDHEGRDNRIQAELAGGEHVKRKDEDADHDDKLGQGLAKVAELALQRGLLFFGGGQDAGDLAHLGVHAGAGHNHAAAAVHNGRAHIGHVLAVAQRHILAVRAKVEGFDELVDRDAFTGQGGFLDLERGAFQDAAVGGNGIAGFQQHHIAGDNLGRVEGHGFAVTQDFAGGGGHRLQRFDRRFGLAFLVHAENRVEQHDNKDDDDFGEALTLKDAQRKGHSGRGKQQQQHRVFELIQEPFEQGGLFGLLELVGAELLQALFRFLRGQAIVGRLFFLQDFFRRQFIRFQSGFLSFRCRRPGGPPCEWMAGGHPPALAG